MSQTQTLFGVDEITAFYDYSNADEDELQEEGRKKLEDMQTHGSVDVRVHDDIEADVGDIISARDNDTGLTVSETVTKKIIKIKDGIATCCYEVGADSTTVTSMSGSSESSGGGRTYLAGRGLSLSGNTFSADVDASDLESVRGLAAKAGSDAREAVSTWSNARIDVGTVDTLAPGSQATARLDGSGLSKTLSLGIPEGAKGDKGDKGDGFASASATVDGSTGAPRVSVSVTGAAQSKRIEFAFSGIKGEKGEKGESGGSVAGMFLAAHPVGSYMETNGMNPNSVAGTWQRSPSVGPLAWLRIG